MLTTQKSITLSGYSQIGGVNVILMNATVTTDKGSMSQPSISQTIIDVATYTANKTECRKDLSDFCQMVYSIQDEVLVATKSEGVNNNEVK